MRSLCERMLIEHLLENGSLEYVKCVCSAEMMPAKVRLCRALAEDRSRAELLENSVLCVGNVIFVGNVSTLGAVKIDEFKAAIVELCDLLCDLVLKVGVLIDVSAGRNVFANVENTAYLSLG